MRQLKLAHVTNRIAWWYKYEVRLGVFNNDRDTAKVTDLIESWWGGRRHRLKMHSSFTTSYNRNVVSLSSVSENPLIEEIIWFFFFVTSLPVVEILRNFASVVNCKRLIHVELFVALWYHQVIYLMHTANCKLVQSTLFSLNASCTEKMAHSPMEGLGWLLAQLEEDVSSTAAGPPHIHLLLAYVRSTYSM